MVKISVIVPVYNVEKYIDKCLKSLVNQTLKDIEIIVVNDGSPDKSQNIIDKYTKKYSNVKSYIKKNGGISEARNFGLKYAKGEYIAFVDSDDYVDSTMFEKLYKKAVEGLFDIVECNLCMVDENGNLIKNVYPTLDYDIYHIQQKKEYMVDMYTSVWNKIYKKNLFDCNVRFKKNVWYEDIEFLYKIIPYVNSIGFTNENLYYYVQRSGSITKTYDDRLFCFIDNWNGIVEFYKKNKFYDKYYNELEYSYVRYLFATFIKQASNYKERKKFKEVVKNAKKNVKQQFPKYKRNIFSYV